VPEVEIFPLVELPPVTPFTCQFTLVLLVLCTVAVNVWLEPPRSEALVGEMETVTDAASAVVADSQRKAQQ
jgi:hypothetical protein